MTEGFNDMDNQENENFEYDTQNMMEADAVNSGTVFSENGDGMENVTDTENVNNTGNVYEAQNMPPQGFFTNMNAGYAETQEDIRTRQQIEQEKAKFEKRRQKAEKKLAKKAAKKAGKSGNGVVFKTFRFVVCAAAFGVIALGTMYFTGDALGIFDSKSDNTVKVSNTKVSTTDSSTKSAIEASVKEGSGTESQTLVTDVSGVVDNVMPSVVAITSTQKVQSGLNSLYGYYFGNSGNQYEEQTGAGSGIIIGQNDTELLIVTNNHVVEDADSLQVQFIDNETVTAQVKGTDYDKDLAVVSVKLSDIKESTLNSIKIATLGDSDKLKVGEGTIAIGNALGYGQSVTVGVISALDREVQYEDRTMTLIQTDAAINPGNSGGALLNTKGEVIGINAAKYSSSSIEGMGFAIPVSSVKDVIEELMNKQTLTKVDSDKKGYLNIYGRDVTDALSEAYNAPVGVLVVEVIKDGAADKAGIEKSDIITKVDGEKVTSMEELQKRLEYYEKGTTVTFTVQYLKDKEYVEKEVEVTLGEQME